MKVSIITLTSNSIKTIKKTINSINRQNYKDIQKIWIDNCSEDGTFEYLKSKKDKQTVLISKKDKGIYFGMNKGLQLAKGDIVGILHSDDYLNGKNIISNIVDKFKKNNVNLVYGDLDYIVRDNKIIRKWIADKEYKRVKNFQYFSKKLKNGWMPPHPTTYFSRKFLNLIGNYDTTYKISSDYDFLVRALINKKISAIYIPKTFIKMKIGGNSNKSIKNIFFKMIEDYKIIKKNKLNGFVSLTLKNLQKIKQIKIDYLKF